MVVRELGPGSAIGELALLTGGTRSASIRARRDSTLAEISRSVFDSAVRADPEALSVLTRVLAEQLQSPQSPPLAVGARPSVVAVLGLHEGAPVAAVAEALVGELRRDLTVATPGRLDAEGVLRAERDHDRVVLVADLADGEGWRFALRQADHLVLVSGDIDPATAADVDRHGADLVLVGPRPARERVRGWSDRLLPWQITYALGEPLNDALRPVAARIAGTSVGPGAGGRRAPGPSPTSGCCRCWPRRGCASTAWPGAASARSSPACTPRGTAPRRSRRSATRSSSAARRSATTPSRRSPWRRGGGPGAPSSGSSARC